MRQIDQGVNAKIKKRKTKQRQAPTENKQAQQKPPNDDGKQNGGSRDGTQGGSNTQMLMEGA